MSGRIDKVPELRREKKTKRELIDWAARKLRRFLLLHPADPRADEAGFTLAAALLDLGEYPRTIELAARMARRFPKSTYLDQFLYIEGYARFWKGEFRRALEILEALVEERFPTKSGELAVSEDRSLAIYLAGQIYHAMRDPVRAIERYRDVRREYSDANEAIQAFERRALGLPELTRVRPGQAVRLKVRHRNISETRLVCYKVDLLKLYLLRRNLEGIARVKLAGIRPCHEARVEFAEGRDYRDHDLVVELPLREVGAYLVVARSGDLDASGMVLVTDLHLDVVEDVAAGRARVTVVRGENRQYVGRAHVKVIGEGNERFVSGDTDLRGLFIADGLLGRITVVARQDGHYAFYRGRVSLGGYGQAQPAAAQRRASGKKAPGKADQRAILEGNFRRMNLDNQGANTSQLRKWLKNEQKGVEVFRAK